MTVVHLKGNYSAEDIFTLEKLTGGKFSFSAGELAGPVRCNVLVAGRVTVDQLSMCRGLRAVVVPYAGIPETTRRALEGHPEICLESIHHNAVSAAEMAVALMLAAAKLLIPSDTALRRNDWSPRYRPEGLLVEDSRVTVLGFGAIGSRVGRICRAMGASVRGISKNPREGLFTGKDLDSLLPETDILVVCLPLTDETEGMIGSRELSLLPRGSVLVNVARGPVVDERALYESLKSNHLAAAGIDVWYRYPDPEGKKTDTPPSRFDFASLPNVVMSPHRGGAFGLPEIERRRLEHLAAALIRLVGGEQ